MKCYFFYQLHVPTNNVWVINMIMILISVMGFQHTSNAQTDSLAITGELGVRGKWQTGNFAQFVINPNGKIIIEKQRTRIEVQANYELLKVNKSSLINDFWTYGIYQYNSEKAFFPMVMTHYGFAQAYAIDHSLIGGLGAGVNLMENTNHRFFQINAFLGHLNLKYENTAIHKAASVGSYMKLKIPLKKDVIYTVLDSHAYLSLKNNSYHSFNSRMILLFHVTKNLGINMTYSLVYNNNNPSVTHKTNGKLVFGLNYAFN